MKWFWYSLIGFCVLMCSCKTKTVAHENNFVSKEKAETNYTKYQALVDTANVLRIDIDKTKLKIIETIKITEYDAESGKPIKETEAKRETIQDSDKVAKEEEQKRIETAQQDSLSHIRKTTKKVESETKEESIGGQEAFGKWFGITIGCVIGLLIVYLIRKFRVNKPFGGVTRFIY